MTVVVLDPDAAEDQGLPRAEAVVSRAFADPDRLAKLSSAFPEIDRLMIDPGASEPAAVAASSSQREPGSPSTGRVASYAVTAATSASVHGR